MKSKNHSQNSQIFSSQKPPPTFVDNFCMLAPDFYLSPPYYVRTQPPKKKKRRRRRMMDVAERGVGGGSSKKGEVAKVPCTYVVLPHNNLARTYTTADTKCRQERAACTPGSTSLFRDAHNCQICTYTSCLLYFSLAPTFSSEKPKGDRFG